MAYATPQTISTLSDRPPPSTAAIAIATALIAGITGYFLGQASTIGLFSNVKSAVRPPSPSTRPSKPSKSSRSDSSLSSSSEDTDTALDSLQDLQDFPGNNEECKLVLVVRTDLGMTKGKIAAQASHATLSCYRTLQAHSPNSPLLRRWERYGQAKVALQAKSEEELETLQAQAITLGLCAQIVHDAGRTQIAAGSATVLGVGPGPKSVVDKVTGHLKLL